MRLRPRPPRERVHVVQQDGLSRHRLKLLKDLDAVLDGDAALGPARRDDLIGIVSRAFAEHQNDLQRLERLHTMPSLELLGNRTKILLGKHIIRTMEELVGLLQDEGGNKDGSDNFTSNNVFSEELLVFSKALTFHAAYAIVKPWTLVAIDQHEIMYNEISRMNANNISGAVVECGVWAGGSSMMMMYSQIRSGSTQRHFWMYDTYQGHVAPDVTKDSETDYNIWKSVTHKDEKNPVPDFGIEAVDNKCVMFYFEKGR